MRTLLLFIFTLSVSLSYGQVNLTGTSYIETFDGIAAGLPTGWTIYKDATSTNLGTTAGTLATAATAWNATSGNFRNCASADGLNALSSLADQTASVDRVLAIRQTGTNGDPGGAMILQIANTTGKSNFNLSFKLQSLDSAGAARTTVWTIDYGIGATPTSFSTASTTPATITTGGSTFTNQTVTVNFGSFLNNQAGPVWIRLVALSVSTGSGSRPTTGIDDFTLTWNNTTSGPFKPSLTAFTPADESVSVPTNTNVTLTFDTTILGSTGPVVIYNLTDATVAATVIPAISGVTIAGKTATLTGLNLPAGKRFAVGFDSSAFTSMVGVKSYGLYDTTIINFTTAPKPDTMTSLSESFGSCMPSLLKIGNFHTYSVSGAQNWQCSTFGHTDNASARMNGFAGGVQLNEDWLISPALQIANTGNLFMQFYSYRQFSGVNGANVLYSTNYTGVGNPNLATWTSLATIDTVNSPLNTWQDFSNLNLSAVANGFFYVAFKYTSDPATMGNVFSWTVDDVQIASAPVIIRPSLLTFTPTNGSINVPVSSSLTMHFDTTVTGGPGLIRIVDLTHGGMQTVAGSASNVSISGANVTVSGLSLQNSTQYNILIDSNAFKFSNANSYGLYDSARWKFTTIGQLDTLSSLNSTFANCTAITGQAAEFKVFNSLGTKKWTCSYYGHSDSSAVYMNGYSSGVQLNIDYLVSPAIHPTTSTFFLHYWQKRRFTGDAKVDVLYSTNYDGVSSPDGFTWTSLYSNTGSMDTVWSQNANLNLTSVANTTFYLAWRYVADATTTGAYEWTIDDVKTTEFPLGIRESQLANLSFQILGNPIESSTLRFQTNLDESGIYQLNIKNILGQTVLSETLKLTIGANQQEIHLPSLAEGLYTIDIHNDSHIGVQKVYIK